jgi:hypothetical protein
MSTRGGWEKLKIKESQVEWGKKNSFWKKREAKCLAYPLAYLLAKQVFKRRDKVEEKHHQQFNYIFLAIQWNKLVQQFSFFLFLQFYLFIFFQ